MNSVQLKEELNAMAFFTPSRFTFYECCGVIDAILGVYMTRGLEFDADKAISVFGEFLKTGHLNFC